MKEKEKMVAEHICLKKTEVGKTEKFNYKVEENDLLMDVKFLINEYYVGTFSANKNSLLLKLNNGQKFKLSLTEVK